MMEIDQFKKRIESVVNECKEILEIIDSELEKSNNASFQQIKEIEATILRFDKQGLQVPNGLKQLKLKLLADYENRKQIITLKQLVFNRMKEIFSHEASMLQKDVFERKNKRASRKRSANYQRPSGGKGYTNLEDYLIPVIKLMNQGIEYKKAFHKVKNQLDVRYTTVSAQCIRTLGLTTDQFVLQVQSGKIIDLLESKYPEKIQLIREELKKL